MDQIPVAKNANANVASPSGLFGSFKHIDNVILCRRGENLDGTLYLAEHHLVFSWRAAVHHTQKTRQRQIWITYPIISNATLRISPAAARQPCAIRLRCRDFTFLALQFAEEAQARSTFDKIKSLTCELGSLERLLAFSYKPPPEELACNGWALYDARKEFRRMGIGPKETDKGWRISEINLDHLYSLTYPSLIVVPSSVSDNVVKHGGAYRSKVRIPALTYLHSVNNCSITRSSQPLVGLFKGKRNAQDERLVAAIFATSQLQPSWKSSDDVHGMGVNDQPSSDDRQEIERLAERAKLSARDEHSMHHSKSESDVKAAKVYGAQQRNLIIDARPTLNARVNQAAGMGSENMEYYKDATINFLGIDNIHTMRDSLHKVIEAFAHTDYTKLPPDQDLLARSKWLKYIRLLLRGADLVARQIGIHHSHVLIHCSDGWDRTSQISSLGQLCLDPYYRTIEGFIVLVEKDWLSFGHMFCRRTGPLSCEKWFEVEDERPTKIQDHSPRGGQTSSNAFGSALMSAKGFFLKKNDSSDSLDTDGGTGRTDGHAKSASTPEVDEKHKTKPSDTSPMFHQFLDATWQLLRQHPTRFEFNERFLRRLLYHLYSCQYGTFLFDSELDRVESKASEKTRSVWDYFLARRDQFTNEQYVATIDDKVIGQERLLFPDSNKVRWWSEVFGRTDVEMNGTASAPAPSLPRDEDHVIAGIESADVAAGSAVTDNPYGYESNDPFISGTDRLIQSFSNISLTGRVSAPVSRSHTPPARRKDDSTNEQVLPTSPTNIRGGLSAQAFARDSAFRDL